MSGVTVPPPGAVEVRESLRAAIRTAYERDRFLFDHRAHERSVVFHIARYLAAHVDSAWPGWSVDVEYDRWHEHEQIPTNKRVATAGQREARAAYPDLIVHRRDGSSVSHNLLVMEVKKVGARGYERDAAKLMAFLEPPFCYRHAVFVDLPAWGIPRWRWLSEPSTGEMTSVFRLGEREDETCHDRS